MAEEKNNCFGDDDKPTLGSLGSFNLASVSVCLKWPLSTHWDSPSFTFFLRVAEIVDRTGFHGLLAKDPTEASKVMQAIVIAFGYPPELNSKSLLSKTPHIIDAMSE